MHSVDSQYHSQCPILILSIIRLSIAVFKESLLFPDIIKTILCHNSPEMACFLLKKIMASRQDRAKIIIAGVRAPDACFHVSVPPISWNARYILQAKSQKSFRSPLFIISKIIFSISIIILFHLASIQAPPRHDYLDICLFVCIFKALHALLASYLNVLIASRLCSRLPYTMMFCRSHHTAFKALHFKHIYCHQNNLFPIVIKIIVIIASLKFSLVSKYAPDANNTIAPNILINMITSAPLPFPALFLSA